MTDYQRKITNYLTAARPEMADFCARLIQTPSVNAVDKERDVAEIIAAQASRLGLHSQVIGQTPERPNVIVSTAESGPTGLLLVGHLDTVPAGDLARWTYPPFSGHIADGKIFGRGAIDTKGGITAALYALAALVKTDDALTPSRAQLICVPDEESGATGTLGVKFLAQQDLLDAQGAIYVYPGTEEMPLGHRGVIRFRLIAYGLAAHTGSSGKQHRKRKGHNAVTAMADLLLHLEQAETPFSKTPYFDRFQAAITPGTVISGGTGINIVPDQCQALVDVRTIPEFDLPQVETALNQAIAAVTARRPGVSFDYELLNHLPPAISDTDAPLFSIVEQVTQSVKSIKPEHVVSGPANEGYLFIRQGIPMVCGFGPSGGNAHAIDEYVEIDSLLEAALIYGLIAQKMARLPGLGP